ncbi:GNAT family N-acetyltransferase [Herpetosiphon gulosus]|uniref:N-acetyltransferase domain-containing protein n=1 Tax=Herpetosiphon gulosus TaxID=1973496 RepID=A0ABP9X1V0_9CHLR
MELALEQVVDAFVCGWVYSRALARTQLQPMGQHYHVSFGEVINGRSDEFLIFDQGQSANVEDFGRAISQQHPLLAHWLTIFTQTTNDYVRLLAPLGYQPLHHETLMSRRLSDSPVEPQTNVQQLSATTALPNHAEFAKSPFALDRLDDSHLGQYLIEVEGQLAAVARLVSLPEGIALVDSVVAAPSFRRRGLARQLMQQLLNDAVAKGCQHSILVASTLGAPLYRQLGYRDRAEVLIFELEKAN